MGLMKVYFFIFYLFYYLMIIFMYDFFTEFRIIIEKILGVTQYILN